MEKFGDVVPCCLCNMQMKNFYGDGKDHSSFDISLIRPPDSTKRLPFAAGRLRISADSIPVSSIWRITICRFDWRLRGHGLT
jgi:hypothetical protein